MLQRVSKSNTPILDEVPSGAINGVNLVFTTTQNFQPSALVVFYNGIKLSQGATNDYVVTASNQFTMNYAPEGDDSLTVNYFPD